MWTHYMFIICLITRIGAQLTDIERYLLILNGQTDTTTKTPVRPNGKSCESNDVQGFCVKRTDCYLDAPKVDPATSFIPREGTIGGAASISFTNTVNQGCDWLKVCCPKDKILAEPKTVKHQKVLGCGYSNPGANVFREQTNAYAYADFGDFPWMVALMLKKNNAAKNFVDEYRGGGSLIHPSVVITAAHKVDDITDPSDLRCRAGEWDTNTEDEFYKHQDRDVKKIVIHNQYLRAHLHNDVALLILESPIDLEDSPHIGVACLEPNLPPPGTSCYSMGWGEDFMKATKYAVVLKKIKLDLVDGNKCQNQYRNSKLGRGYKLDLSLTCAGGEANVDTCVGDGGSSLVCPIQDKNNLRYSVVGMVAYGLECGTGNLPGVYVKIPQVYDWVVTEMTLQGFNKSAFVY